MTSGVKTWRDYHQGPWGQVHIRHAAPTDGILSENALVLFHESPLSSRVWERMLPISGQYRHVLAPDTPGYGLSDPPEAAGREIPEYAAAILAALLEAGV